MIPLVLVADDDARTAALLLGTAPLSDTRFDVCAAENEERALALISERMPDLLVVTADGWNGNTWDALLGQIRGAGCTAPAILVSRSTSVGEAIAMRLGVRDILQKPVSAPVLRNALKNALADLRNRNVMEPLDESLKKNASQIPPQHVPERRESAQETSREFNVLYAIGKSVTSLTDLDQILHRVVDAAVYLASAEQGALMLVDSQHKELVIRAAKNFDEKIARTLRLPTSDSVAGNVFRSGKSVNMGGDQQTKIKTSFLVRAVLYVPLIVGDDVLGVLTVDNQRTSRSFTQRHQRLLEAMADYAAIAIRNGQLLTELQARNAALESAVESMQAADKLKDAMVQNLSHELRTPLVFVKGFLHMLHAGEFGELSKDIMQGLHTSLRRIEDLVKIIENTVALSEPEKITIDSVKVILQEVVNAVVQNYEERAAKSKITIVVDVPDGPLAASGDSDYIVLVLSNLVDNAVKFSPAGGLVTVSGKKLDEALIEVAVSDTGIGIAPEQLDLIFKRFYQVDPSATRKYGGTGLGLSAARQIIESHNGELTVESQLGVGSIFRFTLPHFSGRASPFITT